MRLSVTVNGRVYDKDIPDHITLLTFLREYLGLTGTKEGCGAGECGACMVIMNGRAVNSCLVLAAEADGAGIMTIEGEAKDGKLSRLQESFIEYSGFQCGFCTPGIIMSARALLDANPNPTREEIIQALEGNLCRCTGYEAVIKSVEAAVGADFVQGIAGRARNDESPLGGDGNA